MKDESIDFNKLKVKWKLEDEKKNTVLVLFEKMRDGEVINKDGESGLGN